MRTQMDLRVRRACAAAVVAGLAYAAPNATAANAQVTPTTAPSTAPAPDGVTTPLPAHLVGSATLDYRSDVVVAGKLGAGGAGLPLVLQFQQAGAEGWSSLASTSAGRFGAYRLTARLGHTGAVRVSVAPSAAAALALGSGPIPGSLPVVTTQVPSSPAMAVTVRAGVGVSHARLSVFGAGRASVSGRVYPADAGVAVALQTRAGRTWHSVARGRTGAGGRYRLAFTPQGTEPIRIRVGVDGSDATGIRTLGAVNVYRLAVASWYGPGGTTACGQQLTSATLGVANKTLPCGTLVTFHYGSHTVRVPVIDRGPYVAGREFDLTVATKDALGFGGLGAVWTTAP